MELISFDHTLATLIKTKNDLNKLLTIVVVLTQLMFLGFYAYELVINLYSLHLLIIYACLILCDATYLGFYLVLNQKTKKYNNDKQVHKTLRNIFKYAKYTLKIGAVGFGLYQIMSAERTTLIILMVSLSVFMLLANIVSEIAIKYLERTINRFIVAFYMDREENTLNKLIVSDLDRETANIPNEEELRELIKADKEKYIIPKKENPEKKESWLMKKIKQRLEKEINEK